MILISILRAALFDGIIIIYETITHRRVPPREQLLECWNTPTTARHQKLQQREQTNDKEKKTAADGGKWGNKLMPQNTKYRTRKQVESIPHSPTSQPAAEQIG